MYHCPIMNMGHCSVLMTAFFVFCVDFCTVQFFKLMVNKIITLILQLEFMVCSFFQCANDNK